MNTKYVYIIKIYFIMALTILTDYNKRLTRVIIVNNSLTLNRCHLLLLFHQIESWLSKKNYIFHTIIFSRKRFAYYCY